MYIDSEGTIPENPPFIANGLNLPVDGGIPIEINGTIYYYAISYNSQGELYEYWFDVDGNLVHVRHHSTHGNAAEHSNPHDHDGKKDKNGNNTIDHKRLPVDDNFKSPDLMHNPQLDYETVGAVATGIIIGYAAYQIAKWAVATFLAPVTGGTSYIIAGATP